MASEATAARLSRAGYRSVEEVADADEEALQRVEVVAQTRIWRLLIAAGVA